jgi:ribosome maturation factor RimP
MNININAIIQQTVTGLGYDLIDVERTSGGTLRVTMDVVDGSAQIMVNVEDCERVTRQLQHVLEVEEVDYKRLEVSSPGIDRPLRKPADFERFCGQVIDITLNAPIGQAASPGMAVNRRKFRGTLRRVDAVDEGQSGAAWQIVWRDLPAAKPGAKISAKRLQAEPEQVMRFSLDELKEARLAAVVDFNGRAAALGGSQD